MIGNAGVSAIDEYYIEKADCVVRFNNYATRAGITHTSDKERCDILFSTFDLHSSTARPKDVVIGIPYPFKAREIYPKPKRWYPASRYWMVNPYENMRMCNDMHIDSLGHTHPLPSLGFTALWHMHTWETDFYVTGFEWYYNRETKLFQNWNLKNKKYPTTWNHNYPKELEWTLENLCPRKNFVFSERCRELLQIARKQLL